jgi:hypothetical protein
MIFVSSINLLATHAIKVVYEILRTEGKNAEKEAGANLEVVMAIYHIFLFHTMYLLNLSISML